MLAKGRRLSRKRGVDDLVERGDVQFVLLVVAAKRMGCLCRAVCDSG
jgi:hypothetical protein